MNPNGKPGTDATKCKVSAVTAAKDVESEDNESLFSNGFDKDKKSGSNRDNPALKQ